MSLPLRGIRIVDLTRVLAGPLCTMMLADLGADVIKVERPGGGDETRGWGPPFDERGESAYFLSVNRNKLSVALDLTASEDRALALRLVGDADVVVENFLPGALERAGIRAEDALAANPQLVWCTITGFGPSSRRPGYDFVVQAESGWMAVTGEPEGVPMKSGIALADVIAGKDAAIAVLAALTGRTRGGTRHIVISLLDSARAALVNVAQNALVSGSAPARWGNAHANLVPYQLFRAKDRHVVIAVGSDAQWRACAQALELHELAADPELRTNAGRLRYRSRVVEALAMRVAGEPAADVMRRLEDAGVPCGVVKSVEDALAETPSASALTGMPPAAGGVVRFPPPRLDEHGEAIRERGWDAFSGPRDAG